MSHRQAPVTRRTGKRREVVMRRACSARLRRAMFHWACGTMQRTPSSRAIYAAARARGQSHGRALRELADRLLFANRDAADPEAV